MSTFFKTAAGVVLAVGIASTSTVYAADNEANPSQGSGIGHDHHAHAASKQGGGAQHDGHAGHHDYSDTRG
jgi:hypothetical protein